MFTGLKKRLVDRLYGYYLRVDRTPGRIFDAALPVLSPFVGSSRSTEMRRRLATLRLPLDPLEVTQPPPIELLMVAAEKDFATLNASIESALRNCLNPIVKVVVVSPSNALKRAEEVAIQAVSCSELEVLDEESLLSLSVRTQLKGHFGPRYGWILQQFLCLAYVSKSSAAGVLVLDSDTFLQRPRVFLGNGKQILTPSLERHHPYYTFLHGLSKLYVSEQFTFVSHHMLWQPAVLNDILAILCAGDLGRLADDVVSRADMSEASPLCVKYELYAHGLIALRPESVALAKWSNISAPRSKIPQPILPRRIWRRYERYASISCHDYL